MGLGLGFIGKRQHRQKKAHSAADRLKGQPHHTCGTREHEAGTVPHKSTTSKSVSEAVGRLVSQLIVRAIPQRGVGCYGEVPACDPPVDSHRVLKLGEGSAIVRWEGQERRGHATTLQMGEGLRIPPPLLVHSPDRKRGGKVLKEK